MARMSNDEVRENKDYGDSLQLTNWILDSRARKEKEKARSDEPSSNKIRIVQLGNVIDADLKIILLQNVPSHLKTAKINASRKNLRKKAIVRKTIATMTMTLKYTHLWHECLMMTSGKTKIMAIVRN